MRTPRTSEDLLGAALLDLDRGPVGRREVDRAGRRADVERDAVPRREDGQRVRADLVGGVAVGRDPVRPDEDDVDLAAGHQVPGGHVGEQRVRHAGLGQLPGRQPGALEVRPRLVDPDVERAAGVVGGLDDAERGPVLAAGERPGVAVGEDPDGPVVGRRQDRPARTSRAGRGRSSPRRRSGRPPRASRRRSRRRPRTARRARCSGRGPARRPSAG